MVRTGLSRLTIHSLYEKTQAVTARPSLSGINRDADVWEEDVLPSSSAAAVEWKGEEEKPRLSLVVIGHVDAGKSTLMGQVCSERGVFQWKEGSLCLWWPVSNRSISCAQSSLLSFLVCIVNVSYPSTPTTATYIHD